MRDRRGLFGHFAPIVLLAVWLILAPFSSSSCRRLLTAEYEKLPKNVNRAVYTYRIMDIIRQVRKQKAEIGRIIGDIRAMQKQINSTSGKLQRTEAVAEERLYQGASSFKGKDQNVVDAYKEFSRLRDVRAAPCLCCQVAGTDRSCPFAVSPAV